MDAETIFEYLLALGIGGCFACCFIGIGIAFIRIMISITKE